MPKTLAESFDELAEITPVKRPDVVALWRGYFFIGANSTLTAIMEGDAVNEDLAYSAAMEVVAGPKEQSDGLVAREFSKYVAYTGGERIVHDELMFYAGAHALFRCIATSEGVDVGATQTVWKEIEAWRKTIVTTH